MPRARHDRPHVALIVETSLGAGREILRGIARYVRAHGPWGIYLEPRRLEDSVPGWLKRWQGDGIIVRLSSRKIARAITDTGLPAVDVLGAASAPGIPLVHVDDEAIAQLAAEHLLQRGIRQFGYCGIGGVNWSLRREEAFCQAVAGAGCACRVYHLPAQFRTDRSWEASQQHLARWVAALPKPAGVMVCHDPRGQRVLEACRRAGVRVPDEVAVIGVDNDEPICEVCDPPLSSVIPDFHGIGYEAARLLDRMMRRRRSMPAAQRLAPLGVQARRSTDVLAVESEPVARAVVFIRAHAAEDIRVEDVARAARVSRSMLKRHFRTVLDRTVHAEIMRVRLERVAELLAGTEMPLKWIASRTGFRHTEYLGAAFKRERGQTPGEFRRRMRRGPKAPKDEPKTP